MIYKKEANFPYPLLTNTSDSYEHCEFILDIDLQENTDYYQLMLHQKLNQNFLKI